MSNYLSGSNNRGEFGSGTPRMSKKDKAMFQQELQSSLPNVESIPSVKIIECSANTASVKVSNTEWENSLSEPIYVERGSAMSVNASFLQSRGIQGDLIDFNKSGQSRNDGTLLDYTYFTNNDGANDKKSDPDIKTYYFGNEDVGYSYKKSLLYRWGSTMAEYTVDIGGNGLGIKKVSTYGRDVVDTGQKNPRLDNHPYIECATRVGVKEDQNSPGYFYNKQAEGINIDFQQNGVSWYEAKKDVLGASTVNPCFFVFGYVPNYQAHVGDNTTGESDNEFFLTLRQGIVDVGYNDYTYFQGKPLASQLIRKYPLGYLASSGTNIHIEINPIRTTANLAEVKASNMNEIITFLNSHASGIGGTYCIFKKTKLNDPEKNFLRTNYPNLYSQEALDNANFYLFDPTRGNYLRPDGYNLENNNPHYFYCGAFNDGSFKSTNVHFEIAVNQSYYYLTGADVKAGSRIGHWKAKYNNSSPLSPYIHEFCEPQNSGNQAGGTNGDTQLYRYFGGTNGPADQYEDDETGHPLAMIQKYDGGFFTKTDNVSTVAFKSEDIQFIIDTTGTVVAGITIFKHKIRYTFDSTSAVNCALALSLGGKMCSININSANENIILIGRALQFDNTTPTASTLDFELVAINVDKLAGGHDDSITVCWETNNDNTNNLPTWVNPSTNYPISFFETEMIKGFRCGISFNITKFDIPITKSSNFFGKKDPNYENYLLNYPLIGDTSIYTNQMNKCYEGGCVHFFAQNFGILSKAIQTDNIYDTNSLPRINFGNNERIIHTLNRFTNFNYEDPNPNYLRDDPLDSKNWETQISCNDFKLNYGWCVMRNHFYYETAKNYMSATDIGNDFTQKTHILENAVDYETGQEILNTKLSGIVQNRFCIPVWTSNDPDNYPSFDSMTVKPSSNLSTTGGYFPNSFKARTYYGGELTNNFNENMVETGTYNLWFRMPGIHVRWYDPSIAGSLFGTFTISAGGTGYAVNDIIKCSVAGLGSDSPLFSIKVLTITGSAVATCKLDTFDGTFQVSSTTVYKAITDGGKSGLELKFVVSTRPASSVPRPLRAYVANTKSSLGEDLNQPDFTTKPGQPSSSDHYYQGKQGDSGLEPKPSGLDARFYMMEEPFSMMVNPAYPIIYSEKKYDNGDHLKASQMCGSTNFSLQYNDEVSLFEFVFLHTPYATQFQTETATGGDNSVKVIYPAKDGVENYDCFGGINITSWARPNYLPGSFTNEEIQDNQTNYYQGFESGINPDRDTTDSGAYDTIGSRFLDKLGFDFDLLQEQNAGSTGYDYNNQSGDIKFNGTTGNNLDIASSVISTREATEEEPALETHFGGLNGGGNPARPYGSLIVMPYSFDSATRTVNTSDNHAGVRYDYAGGSFASIGGERITNNLVGMGLQNTTGSQLKYDMLTAPLSFDPCFLGKWTSYTVACGSSAIRGINLPEKTANGYFLVVSDIIDSDGFILSLNNGSPSNIVALIMKNYTSSDFIISYQSPIELYFPKDVIISKIRTKIIDNTFQDPVNIGNNSSIIYSITNQNPSIERKFPSIEDIQNQDYQLMDIVNEQIKANVNKTGAGLMAQTASDINSLSTALTRPSDAMTHPIAQIRNKILQFDLPSMSEAEKIRFMTETNEGQVLAQDIEDFNFMNNAIEEVSLPVPQSTALQTPNEDEGIYNAGQTELRADELRNKLKSAIRQTQRNMSRRGIYSGQVERVGEGVALQEMSDRAKADYKAYKEGLENQQKEYADHIGQLLINQGIPTLDEFEESLGATNMTQEQIKFAYNESLKEHNLPNFEEYQKEIVRTGGKAYTQKGLNKLQKKNEKEFRQLRLVGEGVGGITEGSVRNRRRGYLLEPTVLTSDPESYNTLQERLSGHYSYGMKGQQDLKRKERIEKANNQEVLTREREYDEYYQNFIPTPAQAQPSTFSEFQIERYGNDYGKFKGRPTTGLGEARRRRGEIESQISLMGDVDYKRLLSDVGDGQRMKEVMNRIAPQSEGDPLILPDEFNAIREQSLEALASAPKRSEAGRSESGIGSSLAPTIISEASGIMGSVKSKSYGTGLQTDIRKFFTRKEGNKSQRIKEYADSQRKTPAEQQEEKLEKADYEAEPLKVAEAKEPKTKTKTYTSKRGLLRGNSKLFRYIGPQEQLRFTSRDNKKRAEEIANSFKPKFAEERASRGRLAQPGTAQHTASTNTERRLYTEMVNQMKSEGLLHTPAQTPQTQPQAPQPPPENLE